MRVLINGLQAGNRSGTGRYTEELIRALAELDEDLELTVVWPEGVAPPRERSRLRLEYRPVDPLRRICFDQFGINRLRQQCQAGIVHYPASIGPLGRQPGTVLTVHDLGVFREADWFRSSRAAYYRFAMARSARRAARIIADSEATANDLQQYLDIPPDAIDVIPLGVSPAFSPPDDAARQSIRQKYGLPEDFFLFVGTLEPRKNLSRVLDAWSRIAPDCAYDLAIAGRLGWKNEPLLGAIEQSPFRNRIHLTGYIPEADLPALIGAAHTFVWPSLLEGFGLPPLEAMACGTPVIASKTGSLPEVTGDAALLVDPHHVEAIADAMRQLSRDPALHRQLCERGLDRAAGFTWERTARMTLETYRKALASPCAF
jgi:glycosyltransferase involved in cell wall biosynthesis